MYENIEISKNIQFAPFWTNIYRVNDPYRKLSIESGLKWGKDDM